MRRRAERFAPAGFLSHSEPSPRIWRAGALVKQPENNAPGALRRNGDSLVIVRRRFGITTGSPQAPAGWLIDGTLGGSFGRLSNP